MTDRWVNAVIEMTTVLDVPVDASAEQKRRAVSDAMEKFLPDSPDVVAVGWWEDVTDGEAPPVAEAESSPVSDTPLRDMSSPLVKEHETFMFRQQSGGYLPIEVTRVEPPGPGRSAYRIYFQYLPRSEHPETHWATEGDFLGKVLARHSWAK